MYLSIFIIVVILSQTHTRLSNNFFHLQFVLEKARETVAGHNLGFVGLEAASAEI